MMGVIVKSSDSRELMVRSAAALLRERGYTGTGFREVIVHSGAPRGSIYHHFPAGKAQLAEEAVSWAAGLVEAVIERAAAERDPVTAVRVFVDLWRASLEASEFRAGCPVLAVAVETHDEAPALAAAAAAAFARWEERFALILRDGGVEAERAARLATLSVAAIEGAIVLARARREITPLDDVGRELEATITAALPSD